MTGPAGRGQVRAAGKLRGNPDHQRWPGFRRQATTNWRQPIEDGMPSIGRPELGTLVLAVIRGLIMDIEATGDVSRADQAFDGFLAALAPATTPDSRAVPAQSDADTSTT